MSKITIIEGNSDDKDQVRAYMVKGEPGNDGVSPNLSVSRTGTTVTVTATDPEGTTEAIINDGISPVITTSKTAGVTTVSFVDYEGTKTATINDGTSFEIPTDSIIGFDGETVPGGYEEITSVFDDFKTIKKVSVTPLVVHEGTIIDSLNTEDDPTINAPSIHAVNNALDNLIKKEIIEITTNSTGNAKISDDENVIILSAWISDDSANGLALPYYYKHPTNPIFDGWYVMVRTFTFEPVEDTTVEISYEYINI